MGLKINTIRRRTMEAGIALREGILEPELYPRLLEYFNKQQLNSAYLERQWRQWGKNKGLFHYTAVRGERELAWIVYNPASSTIEEFLLNPDEEGVNLESILDALLIRENLVSALILQEDRSKYQLLVEYGFRPSRIYLEGSFQVIKMELSTSVLLRKLKGYRHGQPQNRETVALEKVPAQGTHEEIKAGLERLLDKLGGIDKYVGWGQRVVIKPNVVSEHGLKEGIYRGGIVTDPRLVKALVEIILPRASQVIIAEGSSINRSETGKMFEHYGYSQIVQLDPKKISLVDLNQDESREKVVPAGKRMSSRNIPLTLEEADVIISVPVMKIHFAALVSLSLKNLQGAVPPLEKYMSHFFGLWQSLININQIVKPDLIIIDGLWGQEGFGPISGTPRQMDLLIAGSNPVAVDAVASRVMGLDPAQVPVCFLAYLQGLGPLEADDIEVLGPKLEEVSQPFQLPELDLSGGRNISIHNGQACRGCYAYLHFVLSKLRKNDPLAKSRVLLDRPMASRVNIFLGPDTEVEIDPQATNIFMGLCQQHHADLGMHIPGCPPHTETIIDTIYSLFPDVQKAKYADQSEEAKLGEMLQTILEMQR
jgi:uncharacterized protein (DUF362 family)